MMKADNGPEAVTLVPDYIYRTHLAARYFGYKSTQLEEKIAAGEIPQPIFLSDSGRARGWFGRQIIKWQADREAAAKRNAKAA